MDSDELCLADRTAIVKADIERLFLMAPGEIRVLWRKCFRKEAPRTLSVRMLVRMLAWKAQEDAFGGHDAATLKMLKAFASKDASKVMLFTKLKSGTDLVRDYQGKRYKVTIGDGCFMWEGRTYNSLSAIAHAIAGVHWNGPRFFGLRSPSGTRAQSRDS